MTRTVLKTLNYLSKIESRHWASLNCMITHWSLLLYNKQNKILIIIKRFVSKQIEFIVTFYSIDDYK